MPEESCWENLRQNPGTKMNLLDTYGTYKLILISFLTAFVAGACNQGTKVEAQLPLTTESDSACYLFVQNRDSIKMLIRNSDGKVKGDLSFLFYEKDKSRGSIDGEMKGDTLFANYTFTSEGTLSSRQVAFLQNHDSFVMGSGEALNTEDKDVFRNPRHIQFNGGVILRKVACN